MGMECIGKEKSMKEILHNGDVNWSLMEMINEMTFKIINILKSIW